MKILSAKKYGVKLKATIQATGKLGFTKATSDALLFAERKYIKFSQSEDESNLFLSVSSEPDEDAFKLSISSGYYSLNTKALFDALSFNYEDSTVIFDLHRAASFDEELQGEAYKMVPRITKKEKNMDS